MSACIEWGKLLDPSIERSVLALGVMTQGLHQIEQVGSIQRVEVTANAELRNEAADALVLEAQGLHLLGMEGFDQGEHIPLLGLEMRRELGLEASPDSLKVVRIQALRGIEQRAERGFQPLVLLKEFISEEGLVGHEDFRDWRRGTQSKS